MKPIKVKRTCGKKGCRGHDTALRIIVPGTARNHKYWLAIGPLDTEAEASDMIKIAVANLDIIQKKVSLAQN